MEEGGSESWMLQEDLDAGAAGAVVVCVRGTKLLWKVLSRSYFLG
jgi:hypothetical protein